MVAMERVPTDRISGTVVALDGRHILLHGPDVDRSSGALRYVGQVVFRYGLALLNRPAEAILPYMVYDDFRREHTGFDALRFMLEIGDSYPRADVLGYRASDGAYREYFMKELDLARPVRLLAYPGPEAVTPFFPVHAVITLAPGADEPEESPGEVSPWLSQLIPVRSVSLSQVDELPALLPELF